MSEGPRNRSATGGSGPRERSDPGAAPGGAPGGEPGGDPGVGVALKQQIGLVSACGIIIGECVSREIVLIQRKNTSHRPQKGSLTSASAQDIHSQLTWLFYVSAVVAGKVFRLDI